VNEKMIESGRKKILSDRTKKEEGEQRKLGKIKKEREKAH
jgi:hypothetical protein